MTSATRTAPSWSQLPHRLRAVVLSAVLAVVLALLAGTAVSGAPHGAPAARRVTAGAAELPAEPPASVTRIVGHGTRPAARQAVRSIRLRPGDTL
ncbi:hypothetical protein ABZ770_35715 [Streptomyces sp. NPDC006654]